jgi:hypothetical protein
MTDDRCQQTFEAVRGDIIPIPADEPGATSAAAPPAVIDPTPLLNSRTEDLRTLLTQD